MLFFLSTMAIVLPSVLGHQCNMPSQMFGSAAYSPNSMEIHSLLMAVDFEEQKAVIWPYYVFNRVSSDEVTLPKAFRYFDFSARKAYNVDREGKCSVETIDPEINFPMVNPATDSDKDDYHGPKYWSTAFKKGDQHLMVLRNSCRPFAGNIVQIKKGKPIPMAYTFWETPIEKYNILNPDISGCE